MADLFNDTYFWTGLAFVIVLLGFLFVGFPGKAASMLDKRAKAIGDELDEAKRLREEAQELLAHFQRRQSEAVSEAEEIVEQARRDADRLAEESRIKLDEQLERRTRAAEEKIERAQEQAEAEVRSAAADIAIAAARRMILEKLTVSQANSLINQSIDELPGKLAS